MVQFAGAARYAYNWALEQQDKNHKEGGKFLSDCTLRKQFTQYKQTNQWLYDIPNRVTAQAINDACNAYLKFFKGLSAYPKFKSRKRSKISFYQRGDRIKFVLDCVKLEKLGKKEIHRCVKISETNRIPQVKYYLNPRITFDGLHWYVSVGVEHPDDNVRVSTNQGIGIDLGIKNLAVCSDGHTYSSINRTDRVRRLEKAKRRKQREISRKYLLNKQGENYVKTKNIEKAELALLKLNNKLTNIRKDYIHKATTDIVKREPSFIVIEDLNITGMLKNKHLSKSIKEQCLYTFRQTIEYKAENAGIKLILADRFYPSSKTCSCCGSIKHNLKLTERTYICNSCGLVIDRDLNASLNLCRLGSSTVSSTGINACRVLNQTKVAKAKSGTVKQEINRSLRAS